jgi:hypothetical protein
MWGLVWIHLTSGWCLLLHEEDNRNNNNNNNNNSVVGLLHRIVVEMLLMFRKYTLWQPPPTPESSTTPQFHVPPKRRRHLPQPHGVPLTLFFSLVLFSLPFTSHYHPFFSCPFHHYLLFFLPSFLPSSYSFIFSLSSFCCLLQSHINHAGSSGNIFHLYSGGIRFESRSWQRLSFSRGFPRSLYDGVE